MPSPRPHMLAAIAIITTTAAAALPVAAATAPATTPPSPPPPAAAADAPADPPAETALNQPWSSWLAAHNALPTDQRAAIAAAFDRFRDSPLLPDELASLGRRLREHGPILAPLAARPLPDADTLEAALLTAPGEVPLPHLRPVRDFARASLALAVAAAADGKHDEAAQWTAAAIHHVRALGAGPSIVEKRAAFEELATLCVHIHAAGHPELRNALAAELAKLQLDPADLFDTRRALATMSAKYAADLRADADHLRTTRGIEILSTDDADAIAAAVESFYAEAAAAWPDPDAADRIRRAESNFPHDRYRPFVSGIVRVRLDHAKAAETIRLSLPSE